MKKFLSKILFASLMLLQIPAAQSTTIYYEETISSVAYVQVIDSVGDEWMGSGFFFSVDGLLLTNAHVIIDTYTGLPAEYINLCVIDDEYSVPSCAMSAYVLAYDESYDLAILYPGYYLDENGDEYGDFLDSDTIMAMEWPYVDFADYPPELGETLSILGFPQASGSSTVVLTEGVVSAFSMLVDDLVWYFTTDATINPGNSGGPVYNYDERVVGVASAYSTNELGGSYGYVISSDTVLYWFLDLVDQGIINQAFVEEAFANDYVEEVESTYETGETGEVEIFSDVDFGDDNAEAISYLETNGIVGGYPDGSFKPGNPLNRAELMKILVEGAGYNPDADEYKNCFPDVIQDWYAKYVCFGAERGWIEGYDDGFFKPENYVNKVEAIKMILEVLDMDLETASTEVYTDVEMGQWYTNYINTAYELGLLEEDADSYYYPSHEITRGGVSENLYRLLIQL
jgi:Trypsin-like peptidase domain/S-layer homology domain